MSDEKTIASTVTEAAQLMGRARSSLYNWKARGAAGFKDNGTVDLVALRGWLNRNWLGHGEDYSEPPPDFEFSLSMVEYYGLQFRLRLAGYGREDVAEWFLAEWNRCGVRKLISETYKRLDREGLSKPENRGLGDEDED